MGSTFAQALPVLVTHLTASGATFSPPITDVRVGEPLPAGNCLAVWYEGDVDSTYFPGGQTLAGNEVAEAVNIRLYWKVGDRTSAWASNLEYQLQAFNDDISGRLNGHRTLGGNCVDLKVEHGRTGWALIDGAWFRTFDIRVVLQFIDVDTFAA